MLSFGCISALVEILNLRLNKILFIENNNIGSNVLFSTNLIYDLGCKYTSTKYVTFDFDDLEYDASALGSQQINDFDGAVSTCKSRE